MTELEHNWDLSWQSWSKTISTEMQEIGQSEHYPLVTRMFKGVEPRGYVLDAGCGLGRWVFLAAKESYGAHGVDLSETALQAARRFANENGLDSFFFKGDLRAMPVSTNVFNCIISLGAVEHFPETAQAIKEFYRIMRPGGNCLITTPNTFSFHGAIGYRLLTLLKSHRLGYLGYEDTYTPKALGRMMKNQGFTQVESGILPTEFLFGVFYNAIPIVGRFLQRVLGKISYAIESRQSTIGFMSYAIGKKLDS